MLPSTALLCDDNTRGTVLGDLGVYYVIIIIKGRCRRQSAATSQSQKGGKSREYGVHTGGGQ